MRFCYAVLLLLIATAAAAQQPRYSEVALAIADRSDLVTLADHGVVLDHPIVERDGDGWVVRAVLNEVELARLDASPIPYRVEVPDLAAAYAARSGATPPPSPSEGFDYGSMGGFYTFDEVVAELDAMRAAYPNLVSEKVSIGQSIEGRDLWAVRISDNPDVDEEEPEALYTALHHAREPQSMATVLYFMYYLLERYGTDDEVTDLVDTVEFYFVPVLNPDGYVFNESTNPDGGGFWRKNRRDNGDGSFGVDLNRNYGYLWGLDDIGSSPNPFSQTYRGSDPFSEPEIAALRDFTEDHTFRTALNYHSRGEEYLYPWGYESGTYTDDDDLFFFTSAEMAADNDYAYGTGADVLYAVNGSSDDWMYGEQATKPKILAWTPEVCNRTTDGFWPPIDRIIPIAQENIPANLIVARLARDLAPPVAVEPGVDERGTLSLYPNPARRDLTIELPADARRLRLVDALGREVQVEDVRFQAGSTLTLDLTGLAPGLYFATVTAHDGTRTVKPVTVVR